MYIHTYTGPFSGHDGADIATKALQWFALAPSAAPAYSSDCIQHNLAGWKLELEWQLTVSRFVLDLMLRNVAAGERFLSYIDPSLSVSILLSLSLSLYCATFPTRRVCIASLMPGWLVDG